MSGTSNVIDVLLLVDADHLVSTGNVVDSVSLFVQRGLVDPHATGNQQEGGDELWFDIKKGDIVRWRATTLSRNFDTTALISNIVLGANDSDYKGVLSPPEYLTFQDVPVAYLKNNDPVDFGSTASTVTVWQAAAEAPGKLWYKIQFYLLDQETRVVGGPYIWDPYITINQ